MNIEAFNLDDLDVYTTKLKLSKILGVSRTTIHEIHKIANSTYDFNADYPHLDYCNEVEPYTKAKLTKYQCWVIWMILILTRRVPRNKLYFLDEFGISMHPIMSQHLSKKSFEFQSTTASTTISTLVKTA